MFQKDILLSEITSFKIGGPARYFFRAKNEKDLISALKKAKEMKLPYYILGKACNVLFADQGFNGLIIKMENKEIEVKDEKLFCQAGVFLSEISEKAKRHNLSGLEWASMVPGTLGGAIYINASAFSYSIADSIEKVRALDADSLEFKEIKDLKFSAKKSIFQREKNLIILSAVLKLKRDDREKIIEREREHSSYRKKTQPLEYPSVGCIFRNPPGTSAGLLIAEAGLKGKKVGGAMISDKHTNFIINFQRATAKDVLKLIEIVKKEVKDKFNITLKEEVEVINY